MKYLNYSIKHQVKSRTHGQICHIGKKNFLIVAVFAKGKNTEKYKTFNKEKYPLYMEKHTNLDRQQK